MSLDVLMIFGFVSSISLFVVHIHLSFFFTLGPLKSYNCDLQAVSCKKIPCLIFLEFHYVF